ncbi:MAG TPA: hypothetical protein VF509_13185 [Sphingobium sp.]
MAHKRRIEQRKTGNEKSSHQDDEISVTESAENRMVANFATVIALFAFARNPAAAHKDRAFQASSPKTFSRPSGRLFFVRWTRALSRCFSLAL